MFGFGQLIEILKKDPKKIVFTEGEDPRILEAASRLLASNFLHPILVGDPEKISASAEKSGFNIRGAEIIDPMNFDRMDEMVELFCELRKSKGVTPEQAKGILSSANYFGTMLVKMGIADSLLGGATYSTADTVRPALQLIKTKPGNTIVSSCFILVRPSATGENEVLAMSDCAINIHPTEDELVEIAGESAECAKIFGIDPKVAFLSYSTLGSGKGEDVDKMRNAAHKAREKYPNLPIEGEIQFDAAVAPRVARTKCPQSEVAGHANTLSSLTSTQEISDTRLHRDLVISKHTAQSFLDSMLQSMTFLVDVMQERFTQWLSSLQHLHKTFNGLFPF